MREHALTESKIRHLELNEPLIVEARTSIASVLQQMREQKRTCALICDGGFCKGIFTERDFVTKIFGKSIDLSQPVEHFMTPSPKTLMLEDTLGLAIRLMDEFGYRNIPLVDEQGKSAGLVQIRDIVDFLAELYPQEVLNVAPRPEQPFSEPDGA